MLATLAGTLLALYLLIADPLLGRISQRRMLAAVAAGTHGARRRFYLQWTAQGWLLLAATLVVTLALAGWSPAELGLRWPTWPHLPALGQRGQGGFVIGLVVGIVAAASVGVFVAVGRARNARSPSGPRAHRAPYRLARNRNLAGMLPQTPAERRAWVGLAVTAGITEEVVWRGFGLGLLFMLLPSAHPAVPIALAAIAFGWAHFYQGAVGIFVTALLGAVLATLYWASGSLLWPIVLHALLDLPPAWQGRKSAPIEGDTP